MKQDKEHWLKVCYAPGDRYGVPRINMQGKWLSDLGYQIGDRIIVSIIGRQLLISPESIDEDTSESLE